jgi:hypothetical protein
MEQATHLGGAIIDANRLREFRRIPMGHYARYILGNVRWRTFAARRSGMRQLANPPPKTET